MFRVYGGQNKTQQPVSMAQSYLENRAEPIKDCVDSSFEELNSDAVSSEEDNLDSRLKGVTGIKDFS